MQDEENIEESFHTEKEGSDPTQWMLSFIDLISLLTAFFVLLYSMSAVKSKEFQEMTKSLRQSLSDEKNIYGSVVDSLTVPKFFAPEAVNLDYLNSLLYNKVNEVPELSRAVITRLDDRMVISLDNYNPFVPGSAELTEEAKKILPYIADIISTIPNQVTVSASPDDNSFASQDDWELGINRALKTAEFLKQKGYFKDINSFSASPKMVFAASQPEGQQKPKHSTRLDIVIDSKAAKTFDY